MVADFSVPLRVYNAVRMPSLDLCIRFNEHAHNEQMEHSGHFPDSKLLFKVAISLWNEIATSAQNVFYVDAVAYDTHFLHFLTWLSEDFTDRAIPRMSRVRMWW